MRAKWFFLLLCVSGMGWAEADAMVIKQGAYNNPPWMIASEGAAVGVIPGYVEGIVERSGKISMPTQWMSFSRAVLELKRGGIDLMVSPMLPDLQEFAEPLISFGELSLNVYSKAPFRPSTIDDLSGKRIAAIPVLGADRFFAEDAQIEWTPVSSEVGGVESVAKGYLDATVCTEVGYQYTVESHGWPRDTLIAALPLGQRAIFGWISQGRAQEAKFIELKRVIQLMTEDGSSDDYLKGVGIDFGFATQ